MFTQHSALSTNFSFLEKRRVFEVGGGCIVYESGEAIDKNKDYCSEEDLLPTREYLEKNKETCGYIISELKGLKDKVSTFSCDASSEGIPIIEMEKKQETKENPEFVLFKELKQKLIEGINSITHDFAVHYGENVEMFLEELIDDNGKKSIIIKNNDDVLLYEITSVYRDKKGEIRCDIDDGLGKTRTRVVPDGVLIFAYSKNNDFKK